MLQELIMLASLLCDFDDLDAPNPRSVTAGHVRVIGFVKSEKGEQAFLPPAPDLVGVV